MRKRVSRRRPAINILKQVSCAAACALSLAGCLNSQKLFGQSQAAAAKTLPDVDCLVGARSVDIDKIRLSYAIPEGMTAVMLYRDGNQISKYEAKYSKGSGTFTDDMLVEGKEYTYTCDATDEGGNRRMGSQSFTLAPLSENAPEFTGIETATRLSPHSVKVTWKRGGKAGGVAVGSYRVYARVGAASDPFGTEPVVTMDSDSLSATVTGLGDELPYSFGVSACSEADNCYYPPLDDGNPATVDPPKTVSVTLLDGGAPQTLGATAIGTENGQIVITAPWTHVLGAVAFREIRMKKATDPSYIALPLIPVTDLAEVPTKLTVSNVDENTTYLFQVSDIDPSGRNNNNSREVTITTGDLTPPAFDQSPSITHGTPADTSLNVTFNAIASQPGTASGANQYHVYVHSGPETGPANSYNPCTAGTKVKTLAASSYANGQPVTVAMADLLPRTKYRYCVKAVDLAGNTSANTSFGSKTTQDITAPVFGGSINGILIKKTPSQIEVSYSPSFSPDTKEFVITYWMNSTDPCADGTLACAGTNPGVKVKRVAYPTTTGAIVKGSDLVYTGGDTFYAVVNACDNAADGGFNSANNCTAFGLANVSFLPIPDQDPPTGFSGVNSAVSPIQGKVTVGWATPAWTSDYAGFKIYTVGSDVGCTLTEFKDCPCAGNNCTTDQPLSCDITGNLQDHRTYLFHVRAYDLAGNTTDDLNPCTNRMQIRTKDTTQPTFAGNLTGTFASGTVTLNWLTGSDNQSDPDDKITYLVYGKNSTTFSDPTNGTAVQAEGALVKTTNDLTATESGAGLPVGSRRYYTVCAKDESNNIRCPGSVAPVDILDSTPPVLPVFEIVRTGTGTGQTWKVRWKMSDNGTAASALQVKVYRQQTTSNAVPASWPSSDLLYDSTGLAADGSGFFSLPADEVPNAIVGTLPAGVWPYLHYKLVVTDSANNPTSLTTFARYATSCPNSTNMVMVPGNLTLGVDDFCIFKYEAKAVLQADPTTIPSSGNGQSYTTSCGANPANCMPAARADGTPWTRIDRTQAAAECGKLDSGAGGFRLPTNAEWSALARNILNVPGNWSNGAVANGALNNGYASGVTGGLAAGSSSIEPNPNDTAAGPAPNGGWYGYTAGSGSWNLKRTHTLSTGAIIWDVSGNIGEWVSSDITIADFSPQQNSTTSVAPIAYNSNVVVAVGNQNQALFGPETVSAASTTFTASHALGRIFLPTDFSTMSGAVHRGGFAWNTGEGAGVLHFDARSTPASSSTLIGFRCAYSPP